MNKKKHYEETQISFNQSPPNSGIKCPKCLAKLEINESKNKEEAEEQRKKKIKKKKKKRN